MSAHVAVLMGGWSAEREVSLVSGAACSDALERLGYQVTRIDAGRDISEKLKEAAPDIVFNALHGRWGEDGCVQGILEVLDIPYTHSGVMASALAMNKPVAKQIFRQIGLSCPADLVMHRDVLFEGDPITRPFVVKPLNEGSSVGVVIVGEGDDISMQSTGPWQDAEELMVEPYIAGRELTVAVLGDRPLQVLELRPTRGFYDYEAKYQDGVTEHIMPADVPQAIADQARETALAAHEVLQCRGVTRADFRYDDTGGTPGHLYLLEINT
ncbi:MAG: D-alanine--D-alanine ligase, partial [Alphaproteobacteria bacterium]|nr:D-alanine--D-alanine ligase [Alphaproteobacteria bacterium]